MIIFLLILLFIIYILFYIISLYFCHLFLVFKKEIPFGGSNPVCICPFDDNIARCKIIRCRHCYTNKSEHRLGQIYHVCCYSMLFVSNTRILSNRSSRPGCSLKRGSPISFAKPALTGKNLPQSLSSNKEETPAHVFSCGNSGKPSRTFL